MNSFYCNDWCTYDNSNLKVNSYLECETPHNIHDALSLQAEAVDKAYSNYVMFLSGGIDSHTKALGFILSGIYVEFVIIKHSYNNKHNNLEIFYAKQFCKKYNVKLTVFEVNYTKKDICALMLEHDFLHSTIGSGSLFQLDGMRKYIAETGYKIVTSHTPFTFSRTDDTCSGYMYKPNSGVLQYLDPNSVIVFDVHSPYLYKYYEYTHRTTPELQVLKQYEAKNLAYGELGLTLRPKLSGWEFLCEKDYSKLSTIDWSDDHSKSARLADGATTILKALNLPESLAKNKPKYKKADSKVKLYSFECELN
jgi:hypothetical protein